MLMFFLGMMAGGAVGVFTMCLCQISGEASRREEQWQREEDQIGNKQ